MVIDLNIYCLLCLKLIKVFKDAIFEKNNIKINKQTKKTQMHRAAKSNT